jgi:hypothetical protein
MTETMDGQFARVKEYLVEMGLQIVSEDAGEHLVVVNDDERAIANLVVDCEDEIVILAQHILDLPEGTDADVLRRLLQMNERLVHGAFALDEGGRRVIFRDTLRLGSLDFEELAGSVNALELGLAEFGAELVGFVSPATA